MPPIPPQVRRFVERQAPEFITRLRQAQAASKPQLSLRLPDFVGDMALVYACLWYGATCRVTIVFVPPDSFEESDEEQDASDLCHEPNP